MTEKEAQSAPYCFMLSAGDLKRLIDKTQFAISNEETRYNLNGIFLHTAEVDGHTMLRAVATDGHRLARVEIPAPDGSIGMPGVIVPEQAVHDLIALASTASDDVEAWVTSNEVRFIFRYGNIEPFMVRANPINHSYPVYERVVPAKNNIIMTVSTGHLKSALIRVASFDRENGICVRMTLDNGSATLAARNTDMGERVEALAAKYDAGPFEIGLNSRYLLDIANVIDGDMMRFEFGRGAMTPVLIRDQNDSSAIYIQMPMKL